MARPFGTTLLKHEAEGSVQHPVECRSVGSWFLGRNFGSCQFHVDVQVTALFIFPQGYMQIPSSRASQVDPQTSGGFFSLRLDVSRFTSEEAKERRSLWCLWRNGASWPQSFPVGKQIGKKNKIRVSRPWLKHLWKLDNRDTSGAYGISLCISAFQ